MLKEHRALLVAGLFGISMFCLNATSAAACGSVTIAGMSWSSAELLANIDAIIMKEGFGCTVEIVPGDTVPTITSMVEKGQPDIAPEGWVDLMPEVIDGGLKSGKIAVASRVLVDGGVQGWWLPKYVVDAHPEIRTINDALKHPELFPAPEHPDKGAVFNGPQGWGGTITVTQLFKAYEAEKAGFILVDPGSAAGLDGSIARAYERKEGWLGYYWEPTALLGKYEMVKLEHGVPYDESEWKRCNTVADCPDPKPNVWPKDRVETLVTTQFAKREEDVMTYLRTRAWSNETVNALLSWMSDNQATGADAAKYFLKNHEDIWIKWVPADVASKVKAGL